MKPSKATQNGQSGKNGQARRNGQATAPASDDVEALIHEAEALKASLRDSLTKTGELIAHLKQHRRQNKRVRSTLLSLRQLQAIDA